MVEESESSEPVETEIEKSTEEKLGSMRIRFENISKVERIFLRTFKNVKHFLDLVVKFDRVNGSNVKIGILEMFQCIEIKLLVIFPVRN